MRLPYIPDPPRTASETDSAIVSRIQTRRAPRPLQPLDLALLHSPPLADGWNSFLLAVRTQTSLPADIREVAISRVAVCNSAWYEWMHHAPLAVQAGVSVEAMEEVVKLPDLHDGAGGKRPEKADLLNEKQWATLVYTDEMTRNVSVKDETFAELKRLFNEREVVEITTTVACYNCVSRFLVALDVGERNGTTPDSLASASH
ncbi:carboxymuconolactone decarboxylase [Zalerion maritima]|uniref:Carboxymuconolactone decarboxylase n=1 Tax=Zalerion maritima TaxID=339359 RepID=A0AAD5RUW9_9PEZI|nr:carboxymuconolactone decarboxylase [Zalerion maritima]